MNKFNISSNFMGLTEQQRNAFIQQLMVGLLSGDKNTFLRSQQTRIIVIIFQDEKWGKNKIKSTWFLNFVGGS